VDDTTVTVEISDKVRVKLNRANVAGMVQAQTQQAKKTVELEKSK
jgi:preprotein translocase subunit YajC